MDKTRSRLLALIAVCGLLIVLIAGFLMLRRLQQLHPAPPPPPPDPYEEIQPDIAPILSPEITTVEEVAEFTDGKPLPPPLEQTAKIRIENDEHTRGRRSAPITLVEYGDLGSAFTAVSHEPLRQFLAQNEGKILWIFRHYPRSSDISAYTPAMASECITLQLGEEGFWEFADTIIQHKQPTTETIYGLAHGLGLDEEKFATCMDTHATYNKVILDLQEAHLKLGINVTPAFVFKNNSTDETRVVEGVNTVEYMQAVLDEML